MSSSSFFESIRQRANRRNARKRKWLMFERLEDRCLLAYSVQHSPYVQLGTAPLEGATDQFDVMWQTIDGANERYKVTYTTNGTNWNEIIVEDPEIASANGATNRQIWSATITGLAYSTTATPVDVQYMVQRINGSGTVIDTLTPATNPVYRTRLEAGDTTGFTFVAYGDSASSGGAADFLKVQTMINSITDANQRIIPAFSLNLGDNAYDSGTHAHFDERFDDTAERIWNNQRIDYLAYGNHDVFTGGGGNVQLTSTTGTSAGNLGVPQEENYDVPRPSISQTVSHPRAEHNFSFDYGDVHFVSIDANYCMVAGGNCYLGSNAQAVLEAELAWAVSDLENSDARWKIVFLHHPVGSVVGHEEHTLDDLYARRVVDDLQNAGADLLLAGHSHNYQRTFPFQYDAPTDTVGWESRGGFVGTDEDVYLKGTGLTQLVVGTGGRTLAYSGDTNTDSEFDDTYVALGLDDNVKFGALRVDVTQDELLLRFMDADSTGANPVFMDEFRIVAAAPPAAFLEAPLDNGPDDSNSVSNEVEVSGLQSQFKIGLIDVGGEGIDDATVVEGTVSISLNSTALTEGTHYRFDYDPDTDEIVLGRIGGYWDVGTYEITLNGGASLIADEGSNEMEETTFDVVINPDTETVTLVDRGSAWKWLHPQNATDPNVANPNFNTTWFTSGFSETGWTTSTVGAVDPLGYGDLNGITPRTIGGAPASGNRYTAYFRFQFQVEDASDVVGLTLNLLRDDGARVYLNGQEVVRDKLAANATYFTLASTPAVDAANESTYFPFTLDPADLVDGTNQLAVEVHQVNASTSSDVGFDLELIGDVAVTVESPEHAWASYLGGNGEYVSRVGADSAGNIYAVGVNGYDAFLAKVDTNRDLDWKLSLGGSGYDSGYDVAVDNADKIWVALYGESTTLPVTATGQAHHGNWDVWVGRYNTSGTLEFGTYLGGSSTETRPRIDLDPAGNAYILINSHSDDWDASIPNVIGSMNGYMDFVLVKINAQDLIPWATYYGASDLSTEYPGDITVDNSGNSYITGYTYGTDLPVTTGVGLQESNAGGVDSFVAKFNTNGTLVRATYLGGSAAEYGYGIGLSVNNEVWVTGYTNSDDIKLEGTQGAGFDTYSNSGGYVIKLDSNLNVLLGSYLGVGSWGYDVDLDEDDNVYVTGFVEGSGLATLGLEGQGFDTTVASRDAIVMKITDAGELAWGTYLGGSAIEADDGFGGVVAIDNDGDLWVGGWTESSNYLAGAAETGFDTTYGPYLEGFLSEISIPSGLTAPAAMFAMFAAAPPAVTWELDQGEILNVFGTTGNDTITITVQDGLVYVNGEQTGIADSDLTEINVLAGAGNDQIDLSGITSAAFCNLTAVEVNGESGDDIYLIGVSTAGAITIVEAASTGSDTIDVSARSAGVTINLASTSSQQLAASPALSIVLSSTTGIENVVGTAYADTFQGNSRNNLLTGGAGNDTLNGYGGSDTVYGGTGSDTIRGGDQSDQLYGDADGDTMYGELDDGYGDSLYGGDGNDLIYGDQGLGYGYGGPDTIQGNAGADVAYGEVANDVMYGGSENDTLHGGEGADSLAGEDGNDNLYGDNGYPSGYYNDDVLTGGNGDDYAYGGYGNDSLYGDSGNDTLDGGAGNDTLRGDSGNDNLTGGYGSDSFIFDGNASGSDTVNESANMDTDTLDFSAFLVGINLSLNSTSAQNVGGSLTLTLSSNAGIENAYGTANDDTIYGNARNNVLKGNNGNDWLYGGYGDDSMYGGDGDDRMYGEAGVDSLFGELGADDLWGGDGTDLLNAGGHAGDQEHQ